MIPRDKVLHFGAGFLAGLTAVIIGWYALIVVFSAGIAKEVYDERKYGGFDWMDAGATFVGGSISTSIINFLK